MVRPVTIFHELTAFVRIKLERAITDRQKASIKARTAVLKTSLKTTPKTDLKKSDFDLPAAPKMGLSIETAKLECGYR